MGRYLGQALIDSLVAALAFEALALLWREDAPARRIRLRLLALGAPLLPLFDLLPVRRQEWFEERFALLSGRHWAELTLLGVQPYLLFIGGLSALGVALLVADVVRFRRVRSDLPVVFCRGDEVVVSPAAAALLDTQEMRAAIDHEHAHIANGDPKLRWMLFGVRILQAFNPVTQVLVRAIARDEERRADDACADRLALASAIVKLYRASGGHHAAAIEERCRRLLKPAPASPPFGGLRLCAAGFSISALLFFVV